MIEPQDTTDAGPSLQRLREEASGLILVRDWNSFESLRKRIEAEGRHFVEFDAASWRSKRDCHMDIAEGLGFPEYYGYNLDAMYDCLCDSQVMATRGTTLMIRRIDSLGHGMPGFCWKFLQVLLDVSSGSGLNPGDVFTVLLSGDPEFPPSRASSIGETFRILTWDPQDWGVD